MGAQPGIVRDFKIEDVADVVRLRCAAFRHRSWKRQEDQEDYFRRIFFDNPWRDQELPSYVLEIDGAIAGFVGVLPRPFRYRGRLILGGVASQLMVAPHARGGAGSRLLRHAFDGPQELLLNDIPTAQSQRIWEQLGGHAVVSYGRRWTRPLRRARHAAGTIGMHPVVRAARFAARPLLSGFDWLGARYGSPAVAIPRPEGSAHPLRLTTVARGFNEMASPDVLHPLYDASSWPWLLAELEAKHPGGLDTAEVLDHRGQLEGWYVATINHGGTALLLQLVARAGRAAAVLNHALIRAYDMGALALDGRFDPFHEETLKSVMQRRQRPGPPILVHAREQELIRAVRDGHAILTGLDGEQWLRF